MLKTGSNWQDLAIVGCLMIDKRMLVDTAIIKKRVGIDEWGKETFGGDLYIDPCRFDESTAHVQSQKSGKSKNRTDQFAGVLYIDTDYCNFEIDRSYIDGKMIVDNQEYIIVKIIPNRHPISKRILTYEIEVI